jgi:YidC/Oxa1 family membrane protein insertase
MDRKSIIVLLVSFALLAIWMLVVPIMYPPVPRPLATNRLATAEVGTTNLAWGTNRSTSMPPSLVEAPKNATPPVVSGLFARPREPERVETLETPEAVYTFTSHGGGLKGIQLKKYRETVGYGAKPAGSSNAMVLLDGQAEVPILGVRDSELPLGEGEFALTRPSANTLRAELVLTNGLTVIKDFSLSTNYLLEARLRLENRGAKPYSLADYYVTAGTTTSLNPRDDPSLLGGFWYNGVKEEAIQAAWFDNRSALSCVGAPSVPRSFYRAGSTNVVWAAVHSQFFTVALLPASNHVASQVLVRRFETAAADLASRRGPPPYAYEASLMYPAVSLAPGQALERGFLVYAGPKEYKTLARIGHNLDVVMGYTGFFGWFAKALLLSMNGLYLLVPNYGLAIILITVIIKVLFWPLTQASTRSMKRMQALQPQMKALQEKYKDDPAKMNKKLMEFMKENKVSPMGGCLPMLLQIPVFIGFYQMIRSAIELRGVHFLWATDLSRPDTIFVIPGLDWLPFFGVPGSGLPINPLPLVMGVTMFYQARMTPPSPGMDPAQQKIMKYMPMMFMVFLYNFSAGLTLYWTVQNLLTIAQMKLTKTQGDTPAGGTAAPVRVAPRKPKQA